MDGVRLGYIDQAKGFAIILVVVGHLIQWNLTGAPSKEIFDYIYSFNMPLFFFISGFLAYKNRDRVKLIELPSLLIKRFKGLALPFLIWGLFVTPIILTRIHNVRDLLVVWRKVILFPEYGYWFLAVLFFMHIYYIVACLLSNAVKDIIKNKIYSKFSDDLFFVIVLLLVWILSHYCVPSRYLSSRYLIMFFGGCLFWKYNLVKRIPKYMVGILCCLFFLFVPLWHFNGTESNIALSTVISLLISPAMLCILSISNLELKGITICGKNSLEIYIVHMLFIRMLYESQLVELNTLALMVLLFVFGYVLSRLSIVIANILKLIPYCSIFLFGKK